MLERMLGRQEEGETEAEENRINRHILLLLLFL